MRNRAKCKLCDSILESFKKDDEVICKCGEISISGGTEIYLCSAKNWENFLRIDEEENEIVIKVENKNSDGSNKPITKKELLKLLREMIESRESMPQEAMITAINQYDILSILYLFESLFSCKDES